MKISIRQRRIKYQILLIGIFAFWSLLSTGMTPTRGYATNPVNPPKAHKHASRISKADSTRVPTPGVKSQVASGEGELIELEAVQIHGEIAQPNVAITVARAKPQFREITLERTPAEGLNDLDLSGLKEGMPPAEKIGHWKQLVNRPRH